MDDSIIDILYYLRDYLYEITYEFRVFYFDLFYDDSNIHSVKLFIFVTIPILFIILEALFDFLLPTLFDLRPMGVSRFFIPKVSSLKTPELKVYNSVKPGSFSRLKLNNRKLSKFNFNYKPEELKRFTFMYQQKYNCTPRPVELRRFILSEAKEYSYINSRTNLSNAKIKGAVIGAASLGKGIHKNILGFKKWRKNRNNKEETAAEASAEIENG